MIKSFNIVKNYNIYFCLVGCHLQSDCQKKRVYNIVACRIEHIPSGQLFVLNTSLAGYKSCRQAQANYIGFEFPKIPSFLQ